MKSLTYFVNRSKTDFSDMLVDVFNNEYDKIYGSEKNNTRYLQVINDPTLIYPYQLDGSHPNMLVRTCIMMSLLHEKKKLNMEAKQFLLQCQLQYINDLIATKRTE